MKRSAAFLFAAIILLTAAASAQKLTVSADPDQIQIGRDIRIEKDRTAPGDLVCIACSITLHGAAGGDIIAVGGSVDVDSHTKGDVVAIGGTARLGPGADIGGDVVVVGGRVERDTAAEVRGTIENPIGGTGASVFGVWFLASLAGLVPFSIVLALLCYAIAGKTRVQNAASTLSRKTGWSVLAGLGVIVAAVALSVLLARISAALVLILWFALFLASILGWTAVCALIGRRISANSTPLVILIMGAFIVALLEAIPLIGGLVILMFLLFALGSAVISGYGSAPAWMEQRLGPPPASAATRGS